MVQTRSHNEGVGAALEAESKSGDGTMLCKMIQLATQRHAGQFDKGGRPYILHPLTVMHRLRSDDEELQCIAVGHDLLEDTPTTMVELARLDFTDRVISGIAALTKWDGMTGGAYREAVKSNPDAVRVKIEDLRHNSDIRRLKGVTPKDVARMVRYHEFYTELKAQLGQKPPVCGTASLSTPSLNPSSLNQSDQS